MPHLYSRLFILVSVLLIAGCTANAKKFNQHKQVSLAAFNHDAPIALEFCERFFVRKKPDLDYLKTYGFQVIEHKKKKKLKNIVFTRGNVPAANNKKGLKWGAISVQSGSLPEPSCGLVDINTTTTIRKMDVKFKTELRKNGYRLKDELETVTALQKGIYAKDGAVYLHETVDTAYKDLKYIKVASSSLRKLKISEKYYDQIRPLIRFIRKENPYGRGYRTFKETYFALDYFEKKFPELDLQVLMSAIRNSNHNQYLAQNSWKKAHQENARIANQQAVAQQQRIQQQQQVFINQSRARNPAPPTGLKQ